MVMGVRGRARVAGEANGRGERGCGSGSVGDGVMLGCDRELGGSAAGGESRRWWETTFTWRPEYYWWWTMVETPLLYYALLSGDGDTKSLVASWGTMVTCYFGLGILWKRAAYVD